MTFESAVLEDILRFKQPVDKTITSYESFDLSFARKKYPTPKNTDFSALVAQLLRDHEFTKAHSNPLHYDKFIKTPLIQNYMGDVELTFPKNKQKSTAKHDIPFTPTVPTPFHKQELRLTKHTGLSETYRDRINAMDRTITPDELNSVAAFLRISPLLDAATLLGATLADKKQQPSKQMREKIDDLMECYKNACGAQADLHRVVHHTITKSTKVRVFDAQTETANDMNNMLIAANACTKRQGDRLHMPAEAFAKDAAQGGSIHYTVCDKEASYNRIYLGVNREGAPFFFHDCIESGNLSWKTLYDYVNAKRENELLGSVLTTIVLANRLGIDTVALADDEMDEIATQLGFGTRTIFNEKGGYEKLGYEADNGLRAWRINSSTKWRVFDPRQYTPASLDAIADQAQHVVRRLQKSSRKQINTLAPDFCAYFGIVLELLDTNPKYNDVSATINTVCDTYAIEPIQLPKPQKVEEHSRFAWLNTLYKQIA